MKRPIHRLRPAVLMITPVLMNACAWLPDSAQRAAMINTPSLEKTMASARASLSRRSVWPAPTWWQIFAAPTLNRLIETAAADSPNLKAVEARLRQAQSLVDVEAANLYPTVGASIRFSAERYSANSTQAKLAGEHFRHLQLNPFVLRYHLDLWGRDKAALQAAVGKAMASELELADARLLLLDAVALAYFELAAVTEKLAIAKQNVACREQLLKLAQARQDSGLVSNAPLLEARIELNNARQQEAALRVEIDLQKNLLATLAGKGPDWGHDIVPERGVLPERLFVPDDLPLRLLARRPDVLAARLRAEAAAEDIKAARTAFYPDVNLVSFAGLHSVSLSDVLLQGSSLAYAVGPSIEFPIFEGGRLRANLTHQEAAYDEAVEVYNSQVLRAVQEVADAFAKWREIEAQLTEQRQSVKDAAESRRLADSLYRQGIKDQGDLLQASAAEYAESIRLTALEGAYFKAATQVANALGGGYFNTVTEIREYAEND
ncbi:MAG: efflux transporter outer membrane subunit [Gammaproteobacteria bacterium]